MKTNLDQQKERWVRQMANTEIDFSYKKHAVHVTYDIESTRDLFTLAMIEDRTLSLMLFGNEQFDDLSNDDLKAQMRRFVDDKETMKLLGVQSPDEMSYHVHRYYVNDEQSIDQFREDLLKMISCTALDEWKHKASVEHQYFTEYRGWNSSRYDLNLLIGTYLATLKLKDKLTPSHIRDISNAIILFSGPDWKLPSHLKSQVGAYFTDGAFKSMKNVSLYADGHIDWALIAKLSESGAEDTTLPPSLKKEMARWGLDIIFDENVGRDDSWTWTKEEKMHLVEYNFNDVLGTKLMGENPILSSALKTRDIVREMYPYTSAKAADPKTLAKYAPPARDLTAANLAGLVLIGPERVKPVDYDAVKYTFPVPDKNGGEKYVDLLEYILETEDFMHPYMKVFFEHFRGKDTRESFDNWKVQKSQPITHCGQMNIPYYDGDGKPIDSFIRVSTGGAHGSVMAGLSQKNDEEIKKWIAADTGATAAQQATIDMKNVIHLDYSSFYPVMAKTMKFYMTAKGIDRYTGIIDYRFVVKDEAGKLYQRLNELKHDGLEASEEFKDVQAKYDKTQEDQMGLKFVLNNATGAGNMHNKYALLPVDNKTLSMRLIGNMLIWALAQRFAARGAYIISTNTDGIYVCNVELEEAEKIVNEYIEDYGMPIEPELMARFVNRNVSTRLDFMYYPDQISKSSGELKHATDLTFSRGSIGQNVPYPLICAKAVLHYIESNENWLNEPYNPNTIRDYIESVAKGEPIPSAWYHIYAGTSARKMTIDGKPAQHINRVFFTKTGSEIGNVGKTYLTKDQKYQFWNDIVDGVPLTEIEKDLGVYGFADALENADNHPLVEFDWVYKYQPTNKDPEEWKPVNAERKKFNLELNDKEFYGDYAAIFKNGQQIGYTLDGDTWYPVKIWKARAVTGYVTNTGVVCNTREELEHFDYSNLDIDSYVLKAETILQNWKVTADIPQIGLRNLDDTVIPATAKKVSKKEQAIQEIYRMYYSATA